MRQSTFAVGLLVAVLCSAASGEDPAVSVTPKFTQPDALRFPDLFTWTDTCNVHVWRDGAAALLINLGDGSVLDHLGEIGVQRVEQVLFTDHHREQCEGAPRLAGTGAKIAGPESERALFEQPAEFRKMNVRLEDRFTVHGASYVRPPVEPVKFDRGFARMDDFSWHGHEFWCLETKGASPGGMSYLVKNGGRWLAFSGDVMLDGARMHTWFDSEWDYGFGAGVYALHGSAALLESFDPAMLLASHGPPVREAKTTLRDFQDKLRHLEPLLLRGYEVNRFASGDQDRVSKPTVVPHVWQITPHLFKFKGPDYYVNFTLLLADNGHALAIDCGLMEAAFLDKSLGMMQERLGLKAIDAVLITHMHGDHFLEAPHLREKWGTQLWTLDRVAEKCEHPERFDYAAPIQAYGRWINSVKIDRTFKDGESFEWEGFKFTADWMPGQTEFAMCVHGEIDGRQVAFTGDNIMANPLDSSQNGHEAMVARTSGILEDGYLKGAEVLARLDPGLIVGGHSFVMDHPAGLIDRYRHWAVDMREMFRLLSADADYRYWFDPYWIRAEPYRVTLKRGGTADVRVIVRNFRDRSQAHHIVLQTPPGVAAEPRALDGTVPAASQRSFPVRLTAGAEAPARVAITAFDITLDGKRLGEWFDFIVNVEMPAAK